jgi:hypothetical protein
MILDEIGGIINVHTVYYLCIYFWNYVHLPHDDKPDLIFVG